MFSQVDQAQAVLSVQNFENRAHNHRTHSRNINTCKIQNLNRIYQRLTNYNVLLKGSLELVIGDYGEKTKH